MVKRLMIHIDEEKCTGCGLCVPGCEEGALEIIEGKAKVVSESYCDGLGACLGHCPEGALTLHEVDTVPFDERAPMEQVKKSRLQEAASSCSPSLDISSKHDVITEETSTMHMKGRESSLQNFPVKMKLIAQNHPALKNARLLVTADCTTIAYPALHEDFLKGRTVIQVCPKFDDFKISLQKLTQIFETNNIHDITVLVMEVPCCGGLVRMIKQAMLAAGKTIPVRSYTIGVQGQILSSAAIV